MLYILISRTRQNLSQQEYKALGELAQSFYTNVPEGIELQADWGANDQSRTFSLIKTERPELLELIQEPFRPYVDIEVVPVTPITGWRGG